MDTWWVVCYERYVTGHYEEGSTERVHGDVVGVGFSWDGAMELLRCYRQAMYGTERALDFYDIIISRGTSA